MKYTVKQETDIQAIVVKANGIINTDTAKEMVLASGLELNYSGFHRCFIDLTNTTVDPNLTMTELFFFVDVLKKAGIKKSVRMAALYVSGGETRLHFGKSANSQGFNLKHFTDRKEAFHWLCL